MNNNDEINLHDRPLDIDNGDDEITPSPGNASEDEDDHDEDSDDDFGDDDSSLLANVPLMEHPGQVPPPKKLEEPPAGLQWKEDAILECFQLAVATHDQTTSNDVGESSSSGPAGWISFEWSVPTNNTDHAATKSDMEFVSSIWKPKILPLPMWAVDPFANAVTITATADVIVTSTDAAAASGQEAHIR